MTNWKHVLKLYNIFCDVNNNSKLDLHETIQGKLPHASWLLEVTLSQCHGHLSWKFKSCTQGDRLLIEKGRWKQKWKARVENQWFSGG